MPKIPPQAPDHDIRCECGKLVARWERDGIAIKCGRCGRVVTIPYRAIQGRPPAE
jgi:phage FluMu protein Com